jgi:gliding motility-associated-like protein
MEGFRVNSDGINQVFQIHFPGPPETFEVAVFNRWGEALYGSEDPRFQWHGKTEKRLCYLPEFTSIP